MTNEELARRSRGILAGSSALVAIAGERQRQDEKWGEQNHEPFVWLAILTEEVGELAQAMLHREFGGPQALALEEEATQVAAVAVALLECCIRNKWKPNEQRRQMNKLSATP